MPARHRLMPIGILFDVLFTIKLPVLRPESLAVSLLGLVFTRHEVDITHFAGRDIELHDGAWPMTYLVAVSGRFDGRMAIDSGVGDPRVEMGYEQPDGQAMMNRFFR